MMNKRMDREAVLRLLLLIVMAAVAAVFLASCASEVRQPAQWPVINVPTIVHRPESEVKAERAEREREAAEKRALEERAERERLEAMPKVSGEYVGNDLQEVLIDISRQANIMISYDRFVQGSVFMSLKDVPFEKAMEMVLFTGGYHYRLIDDVYYVAPVVEDNVNTTWITRSESMRTNYPAGSIVERMKAYENFLAFDERQPHLITINAPPRLLQEIKREIEDLDSLRSQLIIDVIVIDVSYERGYEIGTNFGDFQLGADGTIDFVRGLKAGYQSTVMGNILATIQFLWKHGAVDLKANPKIVAMDGESGSVNVTLEQRFAILTGNVAFPQVFIEVVETGVKLDVTPHLLPDDYVQLLIKPEVSDVVGETKQSSETGAEQTLPVVSRRSVESTLRVRLGETIIIGGLRNTFLREASTRVPGVGHLPIVNFAFSNKRVKKETKEMLVLLTPRLSDGGIEPDEFSSEVKP